MTQLKTKFVLHNPQQKKLLHKVEVYQCWGRVYDEVVCLGDLLAPYQVH